MTAAARASYLPTLAEPASTWPLTVGAVEVEVAHVEPIQLCAVIEATTAAAGRLRARRLDDVLAVLDDVVARWLDPRDPLRQCAERLLPPATGFSAQMIAHGLPLLLEPLRADHIRALLVSELGGRAPRAPRMIMHVLSGNIPGLAATPMLLSLALGAAILVKSAAGDPIFPVLCARSIGERDDLLGQCMAVTYWPGGERELEATAFSRADLVVASGSDVAVAAIAARVPGRCIGHGHKISFAAIGAECLADAGAARDIARRLAYDVSLWDQQGCLSPQLCYVESGAPIAPRAFAELLAEELAASARDLPPRQLRFEEQAAVLRFRHEAEWAPDTTVLASRETLDWSLSLEPDARFLPSCLNRCLRLKVVDDLAALATALPPHRRHLEAAGLAVGPDRMPAVVDRLARCGVHHICAIGTMQRPPLGWRQGGRPHIADWVEAVESDRAVEP